MPWHDRYRSPGALKRETPYWVLERRKRRLARILRVAYVLALAGIAVGTAIGVSAAAARPLASVLVAAHNGELL